MYCYFGWDYLQVNEAKFSKTLKLDVFNALTLNDIEEEDSIYLSKLLLTAKNLAKKHNISESGYRLITNCNKDGGQEIPYLHFHLVGGVSLGKMISLPKDSKKFWKSQK